MAFFRSSNGGGGGANYKAERLTSVPNKIVTDFRPKRICVSCIYGSSDNAMTFWYDEDIDASHSFRYYTTNKNTYSMPWASPNAACINKIEDDGFYIAFNTGMSELYYIAEG